eukprot:TRINITY_DN2014_c0_g1_i1.p1 TRINITY_DN2014_c0_g1~~TRINITY_DN2014_c0_g1_i1.p1  ORF type:complete len:68 (-),score=16.91 TRINITY_DN2014_c0_g1_i1:127-330(-)
MAVFLPPNHKLKGLQAHYANCSKAQQKSFSFDMCFPLVNAAPVQQQQSKYKPDSVKAKKKKKKNRKG